MVVVCSSVAALINACHAFNQIAQPRSVNFPFHLFVNVIGSTEGLRQAGPLRREHDQLLRLFLATGLLGGFTTFSAFSLEAALLWERGEAIAAVFYMVGSVGLAILGIFAGLGIMRTLLA